MSDKYTPVAVDENGILDNNAEYTEEQKLAIEAIKKAFPDQGVAINIDICVEPIDGVDFIIEKDANIIDSSLNTTHGKIVLKYVNK